jgi:hypothetical protein
MDQNPSPEDMRTAQEEAEDNFTNLFHQIFQRLPSFSAQLYFARIHFGLTLSFCELDRDPSRGIISHAEMESFMGSEDRLFNLIAGMDPATTLLMDEFLAFAEAEMARLNSTPPGRPLVPPAIRRFRDTVNNLTHTNAASMLSASSESTHCTICWEAYAASDTVVVLPCHQTHHFHQACLEVRTFPLLIACNAIYVLTSPSYSRGLQFCVARILIAPPVRPWFGTLNHEKVGIACGQVLH